MATGTLANMTTFDQQFYGGFMDRVQTKLNVFNQKSRGTMNLSALFHRGFYSEEAFFTNTMSIQDRDPTSTAIVTPDSLGSDSVKKVKVYKHITASQSLQSFRTLGLSMDEIGFQMGAHAGDASPSAASSPRTSSRRGASSLSLRGRTRTQSMSCPRSRSSVSLPLARLPRRWAASACPAPKTR